MLSVTENTEIGLIYDIISKKWLQQGQHYNKKCRFTYKKILKAEPCVYCGNPQSDGLDHIQPSTRGGVDAWGNRAPACTACDNAKANTSLLIWFIRDNRRIERATRHLKRLLQRQVLRGCESAQVY